MSNVKTVGWLCQAKHAMPVYYFIQENMPRQGPEWPENQITGQMPAQTDVIQFTMSDVNWETGLP